MEVDIRLPPVSDVVVHPPGPPHKVPLKLNTHTTLGGEGRGGEGRGEGRGGEGRGGGKKEGEESEGVEILNVLANTDLKIFDERFHFRVVIVIQKWTNTIQILHDQQIIT